MTDKNADKFTIAVTSQTDLRQGAATCDTKIPPTPQGSTEIMPTTVSLDANS